MKVKKPHKFWPVTALAIASGMRTTVGISALSSYLASAPSPLLKGFPYGILQNKIVSIGLKAMIMLEMTGDKMPNTPNRIEKGGLIGRGLAGGITGAALYKSRNGSAIFGFILGGGVAVAATYGSFYLRKKVGEISNVKDATIGGVEDVLALQTAAVAL